jgi:probable selenium-dependent hydroxylase accessory protein YqeC
MRSQVVTVIGEPHADKLIGVNPDVVTDFIRLADSVLVEADGARTRSLKAPAPYEPVWPRSTSLAVAVVGIDAVGAPLAEEYIHRPDRVSAITGLALGQPVTPAVVAECVTHPEGLFARVPPHARRVLLINKVKTSLQLEASQEIVSCLASRNLSLQVIIADVSPEAVAIWS